MHNNILSIGGSNHIPLDNQLDALTTPPQSARFTYNLLTIARFKVGVPSILFFIFKKFNGHTVVEKVFKVSQCFSSLLFTSTNLLKEIQTGIYLI